MKTNAEIAILLTKNGIRPSIHRVVILQYLMSVKSHPSADTVYEELATKLTTLSKATVYNTLNLFIEKGVAKLVMIDPAEKRFDGDIKSHAHFRCSNCGSLEDIMMTNNQIEALRINSHHQIDVTDIYYSGVCKSCHNTN